MLEVMLNEIQGYDCTWLGSAQASLQGKLQQNPLFLMYFL